jgi:hypothetical protein
VLQEIHHVLILLIEDAHDQSQMLSLPRDEHAKQADCHSGQQTCHAFRNSFHELLLMKDTMKYD